MHYTYITNPKEKGINKKTEEFDTNDINGLINVS